VLKIVYIPLDNRPCNYDFILKAAKIKGIDIITPTEEKLGKFTTHGDVEYIRKWLMNLRNVDYLILSIDMLAYGGLIASREMELNVDPYGFAESIREFKKNNSNCKVYAFNIIMRTSISVKDEKTYEYWKLINEYSSLTYNEHENFSRIKELEKIIPKPILDGYLKARRRNHEVNNISVDLVNDGVIDFLVLGQEDCDKIGIHLLEQERLLTRIRELGLEEKIMMMPGADEFGQILFVRVLNDISRMKIGRLVYDNDCLKYVVAQYENIPIYETLDLHIKAAGFDINEVNDQIILYIITPKIFDDIIWIDDDHYKYLEGVKAEDVYINDEELDAYIKNHKIIIFDLCHANGGWKELIYFLSGNDILHEIYGYTAWNTASNSIGTGLLFYALLYEENKDSKLFLEFLIERFYDDFLYQSIVRPKINKILQKEGENIHLFKEFRYNYNMILCELMKKHDEIIKKSILNKPIKILENLQIKDYHIECSFPWNRTFEIKVDVKVQI